MPAPVNLHPAPACPRAWARRAAGGGGPGGGVGLILAGVGEIRASKSVLEESVGDKLTSL
eukprot:15445521-Alexandrium_andersonii.AAC.1